MPNLNRTSKFLEAVMRRVAKLLVSLFYDDCACIDIVKVGYSGQELLIDISKLIGFPFADNKRQRVSVTGDFLA